MKFQDKLYGKRVLFLSVQTFDYEKEIATQIRDLGAIVDYYDERPANSIFAKGIIRLKRSIIQQRINKYYHQILKDVENTNYDYLLVIKGEVVPSFFLEKFKEMNLKCKCIFYIWDSFANSSHSISILKYFDECFTFDANDALKYKLKFRPLFYIERYGKVRDYLNDKRKYDLLFIGTAHTDRYIISTKVVNWCYNNNLVCYAYYFMHNRKVFAFKKIFDSSFKKIDYKKLSFESLNVDKIIDLYKNTSTVLDINHPKQSGLTMRTFEALGAGKKLITTNCEIKKYTFYNENNICVIDRDNPKLSKAFFNTEFKDIEPELLYYMSIEGWLSELFLDKKNEYWIHGID